MYKSFLIYIFLCLIFTLGFFINPKKAYADIRLQSPTSPIYVTSDQIYVDEQITIDLSITSDNPIFTSTTGSYVIYIFHSDTSSISGKSYDPNCYKLITPTNNGKTLERKNLLIHAPFCSKNKSLLGKWRIEVLMPPNSGIYNPNRKMPFDIEFEIKSTTRQLEIQPFKGITDIGPTEDVKVNLLNAEVGKKYTFWWKKDNGVTAWREKNSSAGVDMTGIPLVVGGNLEEIIIKYNSSGNQTPGSKDILCVGEGIIIPLNLFGTGCNDPLRKKEFNFTLTRQPAASSAPGSSFGSCILTPLIQNQSIKLDETVSLRVENLSPDTEYQIRLTETKAGKTSLVAGGTVKSDPGGEIKKFILATRIQGGVYKLEVIDGQNKQVCNPPVEFNVDSQSSPKSALASGKETACDGTEGIRTAIGCIHTDPKKLIPDLFTFLTGISGTIAFLMMIYGAFKMIMSRGNPQELTNAKQLFTSAIIGLLFIIFAVLLMQIIGLDILALPEFGVQK